MHNILITEIVDYNCNRNVMLYINFYNNKNIVIILKNKLII